MGTVGSEATNYFNPHKSFISCMYFFVKEQPVFDNQLEEKQPKFRAITTDIITLTVYCLYACLWIFKC